MPRPFLECERGSSFLYITLPTFITFFESFWTLAKMNDIVNEINRYATGPNPMSIARRGFNWEILTMCGLKACMAMALYMGYFLLGLIHNGQTVSPPYKFKIFGINAKRYGIYGKLVFLTK